MILIYIDRSRWTRGRTSSMFNSNKQAYDVLGFVGLALGLDDAELTRKPCLTLVERFALDLEDVEIGRNSSISTSARKIRLKNNSPEIIKKLLYYKTVYHTEVMCLEDYVALVNDDKRIGNTEREKLLSRCFHRIGVELRFVDRL